MRLGFGKSMAKKFGNESEYRSGPSLIGNSLFAAAMCWVALAEPQPLFGEGQRRMTMRRATDSTVGAPPGGFLLRGRSRCTTTEIITAGSQRPEGHRI